MKLSQKPIVLAVVVEEEEGGSAAVAVGVVTTIVAIRASLANHAGSSIILRIESWRECQPERNEYQMGEIVNATRPIDVYQAPERADSSTKATR
jgi:hypothetical protein